MNPLAFIQNQQQPYNGNPLAALQSLIMGQGQPEQDPFGGQIPVQSPQPNQYGWDSLNKLAAIDAQEPSYLDYGQGVMPGPQANYSNTPIGNQMNAGGPQLPVQSNKNTATLIQQQLGALPQSQPDTVSNILSGRFNQPDETAGMGGGTNYGDYSQGIVSSALGKPAVGPQFAEARQGEIMKQLIAMKRLEQMAGAGGNTVFAQKLALLNNDPATKNLPEAQKLALAQASQGAGMAYGSNGMSVMPGYIPASTSIKSAEAGAKEQGKSNVEVIMQPKIKAGETAAIEQTKAITQGQIDLPKMVDNGTNAINQIDALLKHPGLKQSIGIPSYLPVIRGTPRADFEARKAQLDSEAFLQAFAAMRGAGAISNIEGEKATTAISRMKNAQSEPEFIAAGNELKTILGQGIQRQRNLATGVTFQSNGGGNQQPSGPDLSDPGFQAFLRSKRHL